MQCRSIILALGIGAISLPGGAQTPPAPNAGRIAMLSYFVGSWSCKGEFPSTGRKIASTLRFESDLGNTILVKHHDDVAPGMYHALEVWVPNSQGALTDTISDNFGGVRTFRTAGWNNDELTWTGDSAVKPTQEFVYRRADDNEFVLDWRVARDGTTFITGDTLTCSRNR